MFAEVVAPVLSRIDAFVEQTHEVLDKEIPWMQWMLNLMPGIKTYPAEANYILCELISDGTLNLAVSTTDELAVKMQRKDFGLHALNGIPGLDNGRFFYVGVKTHEENERFVQALKETLVPHEAI